MTVWSDQGEVRSRMAVAYHFFKDFDTTAPVYNRIRKTYDGPLSLAEESFEALTSLMRITPTCVGTIVEIRIWIVSENYSRIADINRLALFLGCIELASILSQPVQAQALDIDQPEITKGER
jgi:hypothetical protein